ncbi:MAG: hypothetical protein KGJ32_15065 [Xanthomonadaceae bacterium]|nr:hypothetical protein [Xanthomonadaceae bacterium]
MDLSTANRVADQLLKDATEKQAGKSRLTAHWVNVVERLQTGLTTLIFAGIGYTNAQIFVHGLFAQVAVGAVFGLTAAAMIPVKRRTGLTGRRSGRL